MLPCWLVAFSCAPGPSAATPPPEVPLCEPWAGLELPVTAEIRVVTCDVRRLALRGPAEAADQLAEGWQAALDGAGWVARRENAGPGLLSVSYDRGEGADVHLSVIGDADHTQIVLVTAAAP